MKPNTEIPLYLRAKQYLLEQISRMKAGDNKLEPEHTLTEKLGMSRETIRKAMTTLIQEGIITRWHGKGNFGHPDVTNLPMRIDLNSDFRRLLTESGYDVRSFRNDVRKSSASPQMCRRMPEAEGRDIVGYRLDIYGNEVLAVMGYVELFDEIVANMPEEGEYHETMKDFISEYCSTESNHTTAWLMAEHNQEVAQRFSLLPDAPLLCWEEIYYNLFDEKMGYVKVYFNPNVMDLSLLLKF